MSLALKDTESNIESGLGTFTYTIPTTGVYTFQVKSSFQAPSSLSIVINKNASPIFTSATPSSAQTAIDFALKNISCVASDAISVVLSSSAAIDNAPNNVKTLINLYAQTF